MKLRHWRVTTHLLESLNIDPARYWTLVDLFQTLSARREVMNQLGQSRKSLKTMMFLSGLSIALISLVASIGNPPASRYAMVSLGFSTFVLLTVLLPETSNSLVNPTESLILVHQPINGPTYMAAKLTHLLRILLYLIPGYNLIPALLGIWTRGGSSLYPLVHLSLAGLLGIITAMACCSLFGWLIRFVPTARLKSVSQFIELLPMLLVLGIQYMNPLFAQIHPPAWLAEGNRALLLMILVGIAATAGGLRSLSLDYLIRVSGMLQGASRKVEPSSSKRRWEYGALGSWFAGQIGRAGFEFVQNQVKRDWQARRELLALAYSILPLALLFASGWNRPLFTREFTPMHVVPHFFALIFFSLCASMAFGADHKGAWVFQSIPTAAFGDIARGVYAWLWCTFVLVPHAIFLLLWIYLWGLPHALLFALFSISMVSLYLGLEIRLIEGIPFSQKPTTSRQALALTVFLIGGTMAAIVVALQHLVLFRSPLAVAAATMLVAISAYFSTRASLRSFRDKMIATLKKDPEERFALPESVVTNRY